MKNNSVEFEFVDDNVILLKEKRKCEEIDKNTYKCYKSDGDMTTHNFIPDAYYSIMAGPNMVDFDVERWKTSIMPRLSPEINGVLFQFQKEAIYKMVTTRRCMNAASPGLGKSIQGLSCISYFRNKTTTDIILCPSYLRANWFNEIKCWLPDAVDTTIVIDKGGQASIDRIMSHTGIIIISYDMAATMFSKMSTPKAFNTVLMDESHFVKESSTKRYKNLSRPVKKSRNVFLLTGTPSPNRNKELYTQFSLIQPETFYDYRVFTNRYCDGHHDKFNYYDDRGSSNVHELSYLMSKMVIRMRREDYLKDLPNVVRTKLIVTPASVSKQFIKKKSVFINELAKMETSDSAKFKVQALASEMFRDTAIIKIPPVLDYIGTYIKSIDLEKTILFAKHQTMVVALEEFLNKNGYHGKYIKIDGSTDMACRPSLIAKFRDEKSDIVFAILTSGSCSTGLNITPIRKMIFTEMEWSASTLDQCEARINRIGGDKHLEYTYIVCEHSLDEMVFNKLKKKTALATSVVDGGKEYGDFEFHCEKKQKI